MKNCGLILLFYTCFFNVYSQEYIKKEVIDVVKDFQPKVILAHKINSQPLFIDTSQVSVNLKYQVRFEEFRIQQKLDSLRGKLMNRPLLSALYRKHLSIGLGNLLNPNLNFTLGEERNTETMYYTYLKYQGAFLSSLPNEDKYSNLMLGAFFKKILYPFVFNNDIQFKDIYRFDETENVFQNSYVSFNSEMNYTDKSKFYIPKSILISSNLFLREMIFTERNFGFNIKYHGGFNNNTWRSINEIKFQRSNYKDYFHWSNHINIERSSDRIEYKYGMSVDLLNNQWMFFPDFMISHELIKNSLYSYFKFGGERYLYSLGNFYLLNPFLDSSFFSSENIYNSLFSNSTYFLEAGMNGILFKGVGYHISSMVSQNDNYMHFLLLQNESLSNLYRPSLINVKMFHFHSEFDVALNEKLFSFLKADFRSFNSDISYVPKLELGIYIDYYLDDKFSFSSSFRYFGSRDVLQINEESVISLQSEKLSAIFDFNLSINFSINSFLDFYLEGLNLLSQDYLFWQENPVLARQLNFGAKYSF